jgi:prepilin signal peptidase PulO-like enzyme (type II secretory pathway)
MIAWLLTIPLGLRCLTVCAVGLWLGSLVNWAIYSLAYDARAISPWSRRPADLPPRKWYDFLPVVGWLALGREHGKWGRGFWVRPLLLDLAIAGGLTLLYYWEATNQFLPPPGWIPAPAVPPVVATMTLVRFVSHALLILLLTIATFIDFDEKTIPDWITVPGTLLGLAFATVWPYSLPINLIPGAPPTLDFLWLTAPNPWSPALDTSTGLAIGLFCYLGWCFGILHKRWITRRGLQKALAWFCRSIARPGSNWPIVLALAIIGTPLIAVVWTLGGTAWQGLLSALVGAAAGGSLLWAIRIIGTQSLGQEAMGFGDVTLMAMIGAFVGWQGALIAFFLAPFAALFIAVAQYLFTKRKDLAFGPYLAAGGLYVVLRWDPVWQSAGPMFGMGLLIPATVIICLAVMWLMLWSLRKFREWSALAEGEA